jgi:hypothetical protein
MPNHNTSSFLVPPGLLDEATALTGGHKALPQDSQSPQASPPDQPKLAPLHGNDPPKPPLTMTRVNGQGLIEVICQHTGKILCIQMTPHDEFLRKKFDNLTRIDMPDGSIVYLDKALDPAKVPLKPLASYSPMYGDLIAAEIVENNSSLAQACKKLNLWYPQVCAWRREHPEFANSLNDARRDRAELLAEQALTIALETDELNVKSSKTKIDQLEWQAERADKDKYSPTQKVDHKVEATTTLVLDTGIRRSRDVGHEDIELPEAIAAQMQEDHKAATLEDIKAKSHAETEHPPPQVPSAESPAPDVQPEEPQS